MSATPEEIAEYDKKWEQAVEHVFSIIDKDDWKKEKSKEKDVEIYLRHEHPSPFAQIKSVTIVNAPLSAVEANLRKPSTTVDENTPKDKRDGAIERRVLQTVGEGDDAASFIYVVLESGSKLVKPREFLSYSKITHKDGKVALVRVSVENDKLHGVGKDYVRSTLYFQAYIAEAEGENKTKLTFVGHADPSGSVPAFVYNAVATGQGYTVVGMKKEIEAAA